MFKYVSVGSRPLLSLLLMFTLSWLGPAAAQSLSPDAPLDNPEGELELLVHFPLDGSLANHGSLGGEAELHLFGDGSEPQTVEGKYGRALHFDGNGVLALPVDFTNELYKSATVTAWVKIDAGKRSYGTVFSSGSGARLSIESLTAYARPGGPLFYTKNTLKPGEWTFVYAVFDSDGRTATVGKGDEVYVHKLPDPINIREHLYANPQKPDAERVPYVFVGSTNFGSAWPAEKMAIDDVRLYRGAMTSEQVAALANAGSTASAAPASDSMCSASDIGGTYRSVNNVMECTASGNGELACRYGPDHSSLLTLTVAADGGSASGIWQQPSGLGGRAEFEVDSSCALTSGVWGMLDALPDRPWDTSGTVARVGGSEPTGAVSESGSSWGGRTLTDEQLEELRSGVGIYEQQPDDAAAVPGGPGSNRAGRTLTDEQLEELRSEVDIYEQQRDEAQREAERREREAYESELARQQNEIEGQRREDEAAAEAEAVAQATAEEQASTGRPVPVGPRLVSSLSGYEGDEQIALDLVTKFMRVISWRERFDTPCLIYVSDGDSGGTGSDRMMNKCGGWSVTPEMFSLRSASTILRLHDPNAIQGIAVCSSRARRNNRIKGIKIGGGILNNDGTITWVSANDLSEQLTNCDKWHAVVRCSINTSGPDTAATGVVVHYNRHEHHGEPMFEVVGLSLICRDIGLE